MKVFLLLLAISLSSNASDHACFDRYLKSTNTDVNAAGTFLRQATDDCDYPSVDEVVLYVRNAQQLKPWSREGFEDPINCAVHKIVRGSLREFCEGAPLTLTKIKALLLIHSLPIYFKNNPEIAKSAGWLD